jgi:hypothetical protein
MIQNQFDTQQVSVITQNCNMQLFQKPIWYIEQIRKDGIIIFSISCDFLVRHCYKLLELFRAVGFLFPIR